MTEKAQVIEVKGQTGHRRIKKWILILLLIMITGVVSGCVSQPTEEENKENAEKMLQYVSDKYDLEFKKIEYTPGEKGFNDSMEENILIAESEEGILVYVRERLGSKGEYYDNYLNSYASKLADEEVDYSNVNNLVTAKTYAALKQESISYEELKERGTLVKEEFFDLNTFIQVSETADDETLKQLYDVYNQIVAFGFEGWSFVVTFSGDQDKAEDYVNTYLLQTLVWEEYDPSIKEVLRAYDEKLSFEEFKNQLTKVEA